MFPLCQSSTCTSLRLMLETKLAKTAVSSLLHGGGWHLWFILVTAKICTKENVIRQKHVGLFSVCFHMFFIIRYFSCLYFIYHLKFNNYTYLIEISTICRVNWKPAGSVVQYPLFLVETWGQHPATSCKQECEVCDASSPSLQVFPSASSWTPVGQAHW